MFWFSVKWAILSMWELAKQKKMEGLKFMGSLMLMSLAYGSISHEMEKQRAEDIKENLLWREKHENFGLEYRQWNRSELHDLKTGQVTTNDNILNFQRDLIPNPSYRLNRIKYINAPEPKAPEKPQGDTK